MTEPNHPDTEKKRQPQAGAENIPANKPDIEMPTQFGSDIQKILETATESNQWEALETITKRFQELSDLLEKHLKDPSLNVTEKSIDNIDNLIGQLDTMGSFIDAVAQEIDQQSKQLSPLIIKLLKYSVEALKERFGKMQQAAKNIKTAVNNDVSYGDEMKAFKLDKKAFKKYVTEIFGDVEKGLDFTIKDMFARQGVLNFEADVAEVILNGLKVPACVESAFAAYLKRKQEGFEDLDIFNEMYESKYKADFEAERKSIEKELAAKRQQAKAKVEKREDREDDPEYREMVYKNQAYWEQMTPEKMFDQRLRYRAFELLLPSAGQKQISPEVMADLYEEWKEYKGQKELKTFNQEKAN